MPEATVLTRLHPTREGCKLCSLVHACVCWVKSNDQKRGGENERLPTFIDGHDVGDPVPRVKDDASGASGGVQGQHSLDAHEERGRVERLEQNLPSPRSGG